MNPQVLQQALEDLPHPATINSTEQVRRLGSLIDGDLPLQSFLEELLPELCRVFSGQAAVAWMKAQGAPGAVFGIRYRMDALLQSVGEQKKHEKLVQLAWQQRRPMLAEPTRNPSPATDHAPLAVLGDASSAGAQSGQEPSSAATAAMAASLTDEPNNNPTHFPLLFGPVLHLGEPIALFEIVLQHGNRPLTQSHRQLYLRCLKLLAERIYRGLQLRMSMPTATIGQVEEQLKQLTGEVRTLQSQIRCTIETQLLQFQGWSFGSLAENQAFARSIHQLLDSHGLRVACPECGNPAILRCLRAGNAKKGAFVFDHYLETGRTFHGGPTTVPQLRVVSKPARRTALPKNSA